MGCKDFQANEKLSFYRSYNNNMILSMHRSRKFCQRGSKLDKLFLLFDEGIDDPNITINGPSWPAREKPFKWPFASGPMMAQH